MRAVGAWWQIRPAPQSPQPHVDDIAERVIAERETCVQLPDPQLPFIHGSDPSVSLHLDATDIFGVRRSVPENAPVLELKGALRSATTSTCG
jgi:hypothetical protein